MQTRKEHQKERERAFLKYSREFLYKEIQDGDTLKDAYDLAKALLVLARRDIQKEARAERRTRHEVDGMDGRRRNHKGSLTGGLTP